ncbi:MAG TPA: TonB-dependent receptor [Candidatus Sulfotelmatobacter sp.]|nr:TonB-dependent receptor [Candidatus Sulfotelmatobacter sp.]
MGQATSGTITGLVTDPTGAVVPNASVTIRDVARGSSVTTTTNGQGSFTRTQLANGTYNVTVAASGFQPTQQNDIVVDVDRETRVNVTLSLGSASQTVQVTANEAPVLQTDRAEISTTLPASDLTSIPTLGQNVTQLELLSPGTVRNTYDIAGAENPQGGQANNTDGLLFGFTNRQIDGADDMDAVLGIQVVNPPPDSLDEMKVTSSNYDAEFGRSGGSFVSYTTKSGSNQWHGDLFEYLRNNYFDARNPYTEIIRQQPLRFNQFGGSVGGKVIRDKLFFFGTYQGQRERLGGGFQEFVPSAADRTGNLTDIGGPVLPSGAISPVASSLLALIPLPNIGANTYLGTGSVKFNSDQYDARVDYNVNPNNRIFVRYDLFRDTINSPAIFGLAGGPSFSSLYGPGNATGQNHNGAVNWNHVFGPSWLLNLRYSYFRYQIDNLPVDYGTNTATTVGIPGINQGTADTSGLSNFIFNGTALSGTTVSGFPSSSFQFGTTINTNAPLHELEQLHQLSPVATKELGNHEIKFGGDYRWVVNYRSSSDFSQRGVFGFNSGVATTFGTTTDAFESFLLGEPSTFQRFQFLGIPKEYEQDVFAFVQDRWRVNPKLTLSFGLRWELYTAPYAHRGDGANFNLQTGLLMVAGVGGVDRYTDINTRTDNFAPRIGIAYQFRPNTVIRAGYGRSYFPDFFSIQISHNYPVDYAQDLTASTGQALPFTLSEGPPLPTPPAVPSSGMLPLPTGVSATGIPLNRKTAYVDMYNVALQQGIGKNFSVQVAYVGNMARHLFDFYNANAPVPGPGLSNDNRPYFPAFGYTQDITTFADDLSSNYNSLQVSAQNRLSAWYSITAQYTYSRAINSGDDSREFNPYDLAADYGPAGFDRTQAFSLGHVLQIPVGRGQRYLQNMSRGEQLILGGWQFTGLTNAYTGRPYTPIYGTTTSLNSNFPLKAFQIGDPNANIPAGLQFNPAAYVPIATVLSDPSYAFQEGNAGRNSLRGPGFFEADWALGKTFKLTERQSLAFAWQNFNVFNKVNRGLPVNDLTSSNVGTITSLETFALPRTMQFSLRYTF